MHTDVTQHAEVHDGDADPELSITATVAPITALYDTTDAVADAQVVRDVATDWQAPELAVFAGLKAASDMLARSWEVLQTDVAVP